MRVQSQRQASSVIGHGVGSGCKENCGREQVCNAALNTEPMTRPLWVWVACISGGEHGNATRMVIKPAGDDIGTGILRWNVQRGRGPAFRIAS